MVANAKDLAEEVLGRVTGFICIKFYVHLLVHEVSILLA